jgi:hypothetical protein
MQHWFYKIPLTFGVLLICMSPFWLYLGRAWFGRSLCHHENFGPLFPHGQLMPCADVYLRLGIETAVSCLILGCIPTYIGIHLRPKATKK